MIEASFRTRVNIHAEIIGPVDAKGVGDVTNKLRAALQGEFDLHVHYLSEGEEDCRACQEWEAERGRP